MAEICPIWGFTDVLWKDANWTWSECQIIQDIVTAIVQPDGVDATTYGLIVLRGDQTPAIVQPDGVDATTLIQPWLIEPWNPYRAGEKKKKLIRLICKVRGMEFDESKETNDFNVSVEDIKLIIDKAMNIGFGVKGKK